MRLTAWRRSCRRPSSQTTRHQEAESSSPVGAPRSSWATQCCCRTQQALPVGRSRRETLLSSASGGVRSFRTKRRKVAQRGSATQRPSPSTVSAQGATGVRDTARTFFAASCEWVTHGGSSIRHSASGRTSTEASSFSTTTERCQSVVVLSTIPPLLGASRSFTIRKRHRRALCLP